jgi:hypothetical protein
MAADPIDLTTVAAVKERIVIATADTGADDILQALITAASELIQSMSETTLAAATDIVRVYNGTGSNLLDLRDRPITGITEIHESAEQLFDADHLLAASTYFVDLRLGHVYKDNFALWPRFPQSIQVKYDAGYATIPAGLAEAAKSLVVAKWRKKDSDGLQSKNLGDGSVVYFTPNDVTQDIQRQLGPYMGGGVLI